MVGPFETLPQAQATTLNAQRTTHNAVRRHGRRDADGSRHSRRTATRDQSPAYHPPVYTLYRLTLYRQRVTNAKEHRAKACGMREGWPLSWPQAAPPDTRTGGGRVGAGVHGRRAQRAFAHTTVHFRSCTTTSHMVCFCNTEWIRAGKASQSLTEGGGYRACSSSLRHTWWIHLLFSETMPWLDSPTDRAFVS